MCNVQQMSDIESKAFDIMLDSHFYININSNILALSDGVLAYTDCISVGVYDLHSTSAVNFVWFG